MQSLLSQAESSVIQSFLSSMDYTDDHAASLSASEWALFSAPPPEYTNNDDLLNPMANTENKDALMKATKDLMSLDSDRWSNNDSSMMNHQPQHQQHPHQQQHQQQQHQHFDSRGQLMTYPHQPLNHPSNHIHPHQNIQHGHVSFSQGGGAGGGGATQGTQDVFPFMHSKPQQQSMHYSMTMQPHPLSLSTLNTSSTDQPLSAGSSLTPTTPISPFAFPPSNHHHLSQQQHIQQQQQQQQLHHARHQQQSFQQQPPALQIQTRQNGHHNAHASPSTSSPPLSTLSASSSRSASVMSPNGAGPSSKQRRASPRTANGVHTGTISTNGNGNNNGSASGGQPKQTLLSPSQKKANHIQSEQKRRANIRRGYEALCETVPALREAIREEEEAERRMRAGIGPAPGARKKGRGKKGKDGDEKEKVDGRAGPRSENVVLSK
ncbi:hypothetical protein CVT24_000551, partial [Panaeolus cyanescens]